jgi:type IV pilus assembly protein PilZ
LREAGSLGTGGWYHRKGPTPPGEQRWSNFADMLAEFHQAFGKDLSVGGMLILADNPASFGAEVIVKITLPGQNRELTLPGVVRWTRIDGMGIQFGNLGAHDTHAILEYIGKHSS